MGLPSGVLRRAASKTRGVLVRNRQKRTFFPHFYPKNTLYRVFFGTFRRVIFGEINALSMKFFYLSFKANGKGGFEIHEKECELIPEPLDRDYLGPFNNGREALRKALLMKSAAVCCESCCKSTFEAVFNSAKTDKA